MKGLRYLRDNHKVIHRGTLVVCLCVGNFEFDGCDNDMMTHTGIIVCRDVDSLSVSVDIQL